MRFRRPLLAVLVASFALISGPGCARGGKPDQWVAPSLQQPPVPTREQVTVLLPPVAEVATDRASASRILEDAFTAQLRHATTVEGGAALGEPLRKAGLGAVPGQLMVAMVGSAFDDDSEVLGAQYGDVVGVLDRLFRLVDAQYEGRPVRWLALLRAEELPSPRDSQALIEFQAGLWDAERGLVATVIKFQRFAAEGTLEATLRTGAIDAAALLVHEPGPSSDAAVDSALPEPQAP